MKVDKSTYYIIQSPNKCTTGVLRSGQELSTKHNVEVFEDYSQYMDKCHDLEVQPVEEVTYDFADDKGYISAAQCQVQLDEMGLLDTVQTYMNNNASSKERIFWTVGKNYYRYSPTIEKLGQMLEIDLDEFWEAARKVVI